MSRPAYVLPEDAVAGGGPVNFPGFPGSWTPGEPIAVDAILQHAGYADADELHARVEELGLPLEQTTVATDEGAMPMPANHVRNRAEAADDALEDTRPRARSHKELDKQAADLGVEFSSPRLSVADKQAEIDAAVAARELVPEPAEQAEGEES